MSATAYYKIVGLAGEPLHGGSGVWPLPVDGQPGEWREVDGDVIPCRNGLHLTTRDHLSHWTPSSGAFVVYRAEVDGEVVDAGDKVAARRVRLLPRAADRPAPDYARLEARKARAYARAERAYKRAMRSAPVIPAAWRAYLSGIGSTRLPAGHPGQTYAAEMAAWRPTELRAGSERGRMLAAADRAYRDAITAAILPD